MVLLDCSPTPSNLRDIATVSRQFEDAGASGIWTGESARGITPALAVVAQSTTQALVGAGIYVAPYRHPLSLAQEIMDMTEIFGTRFRAGIGIRSPDLVKHQTGISIDSPVDYMRDYVRALRAVIHGSDSGRCRFRSGNFRVRFPPIMPVFNGDPDIKLLMAGLGPKMVQLALDEGDGLILHPIHSTTDTAQIAATTDIQTRRAKGFEVVSYRLVWHSDWPEHFKAGLKANMAFYGLAKPYLTHRERVQFSPGDTMRVRQALARHEYDVAGGLVTDEVFAEIALAGNTVELVEQIMEEGRYADRIVLTLPWFGFSLDDYSIMMENLLAVFGGLAAGVKERTAVL